MAMNPKQASFVEQYLPVLTRRAKKFFRCWLPLEDRDDRIATAIGHGWMLFDRMPHLSPGSLAWRACYKALAQPTLAGLRQARHGSVRMVQHPGWEGAANRELRPWWDASFAEQWQLFTESLGQRRLQQVAEWLRTGGWGTYDELARRVGCKRQNVMSLVYRVHAAWRAFSQR